MSKPGDHFVILRLSAGLPLTVSILETDERPLMADDENLAGILDSAIDVAAYEGDWQGLVRLRECLLKWAEDAEAALKQIAEQGPYRDTKGSSHEQ